MIFAHLKKIFSTSTQKKYWPWLRGYTAELLASSYLIFCRYKIIAHRVKTPYGEIDLIAKKGSAYIFIEVKYRSHDHQGAYALTPKQIRRITQAATSYQRNIPPTAQIRFDVILINRYYQLKHHLNALTIDHAL